MPNILRKALIALILVLVGLGTVKWLQNKNKPAGADSSIETGHSGSQPSATSGSVAKPAPSSTDTNPAFIDHSDGARDSQQTENIPQSTNPKVTSQPPAAAVEPKTPTQPISQDHIEVPQSYSVERAAEFFIPAEQRSPGNLGGPPPPPAALLKGLSAPPAAPSAPSLKPPSTPQ